MKPEDIKKMREELGITQEDLATILGVTKTTVGRYEIGKAKPVGDAMQKLLQIKMGMENPEHASLLKEVIQNVGGTAIAAGLLSFSSALFPLSGAVAGGIGLAALCRSPAGKNFVDFLTKLQK